MKRFLAGIISVLLICNMSSAIAETQNHAIVFSDNFDLHDIGKSPSVYNSLWNVTTSGADDSVTIETDSVTGSKAIKIVNTSTSAISLYADIPNISSGKFWYSFTFRAENDSRYIPKFGALRSDNDWYGVIAMVSRVGWVYRGDDSIGGIDNTVHEFKVFVDADEKTYDIYRDSALKYSGDYKSSAAEDIGRIDFSIENNAVFNGEADGSAIYWIDNVKIERLALELDEYIPQEENNVGIDSVVCMKFNTPLNPGFVSADYFDVSIDGISLAKGKYTVSSEDNTTVSIDITGGLEYGKSYKITAKKEIQADDIGYIGLNDDFVILFKTKSIITQITGVVENGRYDGSVTPAVSVADGITYEASLSKNDEAATSFTVGNTISEIGDYVLTITASDENGKKEIKSVGFTIVDRVAPIATNVIISGIAATDETLTGDYDFYDDNHDEQGISTFRWLRCDTIDGEYKEIEDADDITYVLTREDENKYIKFEVTPVSLNEPYVGKSVLSKPFLGAKAPYAKSLKITASEQKPNVNVTLTAEYVFADENGDTPQEPVIKWHRSDNGKDYTEIENASALSYTLTEADRGKYIKCLVTPVSSRKPVNGAVAESNVYTSFFAPEAKNVKIEGTASVGQVLAAFYEFYDENGDEEGASICQWYSGEEKISEGPSLNVSDSLSGKSITLKVIPVSKNYPYEGVAVTGNSVRISSKQISSGGGGLPIKNMTSQKEETSNKEENIPSQDKGFSDITNHWAKNDIEKLVEKGILNGISDNKFSPDSYLTRGQFAAIISRAISINEEKGAEFKDVATDAWYYEAVQKVSAAGLMNGSSGGFNPEDCITREEMCVVINNVLKYKNINNADDGTAEFSDMTNVAPWAMESVNFVASSGIINGMGDGTFAPKENVTRAQTAAVCNRMLSILGGE